MTSRGEVPIVPPGPALESPALYHGAARAPAFEVKYVLTEDEAREVERRLRPRLAPDPHGDAYRITSVYFDTPGFAVYHRGEGHRSRKYRVRRYGAEPTAFLELKTKRGGQVKKRRTQVPLDGLAWLAGPVPPDWPGAWFARRLALRGLRPVCRVTYERVAYVGSSASGPVRLTFDRAAHGLAADGPNPEPFAGGPPLLDGEVVVEFKFLGAMPAVFKDAVAALRLSARSGSKYRRCVDALDLIETKDEPDA